MKLNLFKKIIYGMEEILVVELGLFYLNMKLRIARRDSSAHWQEMVQRIGVADKNLAVMRPTIERSRKKAWQQNVIKKWRVSPRYGMDAKAVRKLMREHAGRSPLGTRGTQAKGRI